MSNSNLLVRIDSSARGTASNSRHLTDYLTQQLLAREEALQLVSHDVGENPFPQVTAEQLTAIHGSFDSEDPDILMQQALSDELVDEVLQTRYLIIGAPMYNFGIPANLKTWIDHICRARKTFRYTENGPEGLSGIEEAFVVVASGGAPVGSAVDFVSSYLRQVLGFIGVRKVHIVDAGGSGADADGVRAKAKAQIDELVGSLAEA